ncbi:hypothetical protein F8388_012760 [Cannabis sativa]|uniref:Uncharacterized protein n=1 Tax=Cannabis sativa TaxID=3483 RepID=A0A7J6F415_CANSA|nr:hypothetical protein F8388_012760 [Cannabis sativa]
MGHLTIIRHQIWWQIEHWNRRMLLLLMMIMTTHSLSIPSPPPAAAGASSSCSSGNRSNVAFIKVAPMTITGPDATKAPRDDTPWSSRLPECDVGDNAAAAQDRNPTVSPLSKSGYALNYVTSATDFQNVASKSVWALLCDHYRRLRLVLGTRGSATWPAIAASSSSSTSTWLEAFVTG